MVPIRYLIIGLAPFFLAFNLNAALAQTAAPAANTSKGQVVAEQSPSPQRPRMTVLGILDAGQPGVGIYKMFDPSDQVICYVLMPEVAGRKMVGNAWIYDGNSIGSISCVKITLPNKPPDAANTVEPAAKTQKK